MKGTTRSTRLTLVVALVAQACIGSALAMDAASPATATAQPATVGDGDAKALERLPLLRPPRIPLAYTLPGTFAFRTTRGYYLTAVNGGGRSDAPTVITATSTAGPWEQFRINVDPAQAWDKSLQTAMGNYVTAVNGGGMTSNALHTDATHVGSWEQFRMIDLSEQRFAPTFYALYTIGNRTVTAVGAGGRYDDAIHTDGTQVGSWEELRPVKCGDLGSGYEYYILPADGYMLTAADGGGRADDDAIVRGFWFGEPDNAQWSRFRLMRQPDGWYALQTSNGANYVTALGGGGQVQQYVRCDPGLFGACIDGFTGIFHTDATVVRGWERFRIVDMGDCKYAIQTSSGFYMGIYQTPQGMLLTTRRSTISANEKFEFVMSGLGSPPIFH
jgi:hypothetical protein